MAFAPSWSNITTAAEGKEKLKPLLEIQEMAGVSLFNRSNKNNDFY